MKKHTPEFSKAASLLTLKNVFFTALLYNMKIEAREDLPSPAATDGVHLYYNPKLFKKEFTDSERVFVLVHELLHVILFHCLRRGIRNPQRWNIACDHAVNLLCVEYGFTKPKDCYCDPQYRGMAAERIYELLPEDCGKSDGDVLDYNPGQNDGKSKGDVERETAIYTEQAAQAAKAAGQEPGGMKRAIKSAQVQREPWYQHLRRYMTAMTARQYTWARLNTKHLIMHGIASPHQKSESLGKVVFWVDSSGSITEKQLGAMGAHISDLLRDVTPSEVVVGYFDSKVCHVDTFTGPDYHIRLEPHGGGGTHFEPMFEYMQERHADAQVTIVFTDLHGLFGEGNPVCDTLWISQTETVDVPFGELIYGDLNES